MNELREKYVRFLSGFLALEEPVRAVFDFSNGTTAPIVKAVVASNQNIEADFLNDTPDGQFPGHGPDPSAPGATDALSRRVVENKADVGVIFDGDGDRVLFVDEAGDLLRGAEVFAFLLPRFAPPYVANTALGKEVLQWLVPSAEIVESKTGHVFMKRAMRKVNAEFGAERSGHYYFKEFFYGDAGILASLFVLGEVSRKKKQGITLSLWRGGLPAVYESGELNLEIEDKDAAVGNVKQFFKKERIREVDGVTIDGEDFWLNVRPSNTEPLLRVNVAARSKEVLEEKQSSLLHLLQ